MVCSPSVRSRWLENGHLCTKMESSSINQPQKKHWLTFSHLDQTSSVNQGFVMWILGKVFLQDRAACPEQARYCSFILTAQVTNHRAEFGLSCPLTEQAIQQISLAILLISTLRNVWRLVGRICMLIQGLKVLRIIYVRVSAVQDKCVYSISAFASHHQQDSLLINQIADVDKTIVCQNVGLPFSIGPFNFM